MGFIGRDETILKPDRAFDGQNVVLLHAYAGSGKTSTAAECARWYGETGELKGPVLFTSFEQKKLLPQVLNELSREFEPARAKNGIQWLTLDDAQRRDVALQVLRQVPVLWITWSRSPVFQRTRPRPGARMSRRNWPISCARLAEPRQNSS